MTTGRPVKVTEQHPLPAGFDFMDVYEVEMMAAIGSAMGFWFRNGFMDYLNDKYEAIVLYLKVSRRYFVCRRDPVGPDTAC